MPKYKYRISKYERPICGYAFVVEKKEVGFFESLFFGWEHVDYFRTLTEAENHCSNEVIKIHKPKTTVIKIITP